MYGAIIGIFWNTGQTGETVISNNYFKSIYGIYTNSETKNKLNLSNLYKYEVLGSMNAKLRKRNYSKKMKIKLWSFGSWDRKALGIRFVKDKYLYFYESVLWNEGRTHLLGHQEPPGFESRLPCSVLCRIKVIHWVIYSIEYSINIWLWFMVFCQDSKVYTLIHG